MTMKIDEIIRNLEEMVELARQEWGKAEAQAKAAYREYVRLCGELRAAEDDRDKERVQ